MITEEKVQNEQQPQQPEESQEQVSDLERRLKEVDTYDESQSPEEGNEETSAQREEPQSPQQLPDVSELGLPEGQPQAEPTESVEEKPAPEVPKEFKDQFKEYLGFDLEELRAGVQELQSYRDQLRAEEARVTNQKLLEEIRNEWGVDQQEFDNRLNLVLERFNKYPPEMRERLDTPEGMRLIWARLEQEAQQSGVPYFPKSTGRSSGGKKFLFTQSEINNMSNEEYYKNSTQIVKAYKLGLVDKSR